MTAAPLIVLVGNPNAGKTTLFNALTGLSARVGNYPGITVEHKQGKLALGDVTTRVIDLPGCYSLVPRSDDEVVALRGVVGRLPNTPAADVIVAVIDATQLERNLYLLAQLRELPLPVVVALTMTDTIQADGRTLDVGALGARLGVPTVAAPAVSGGSDALRALLADLLGKSKTRSVGRTPLNPVKDNEKKAMPPSVRAAGEALAQAWRMPEAVEALGQLAVCALAGDALDRLPGVTSDVRAAVLAAADPTEAGRLAARYVAQRYQRVAQWADGVIQTAAPAADTAMGGDATPRSARITRAIDALALNRVLGPALMFGVFFLLFVALFSWAEPIMTAVEGLIAWASRAAGDVLPADMPLFRSLVQDGIIAGVGNVIVFVPQIAILFFFLSVLEDSGYLARAAFLLDRLMARTGLHGRAFVPLLSGFACAVPAILATRTIENDKDRIVTILVTPLISCSARLPVYGLMIATVFATTPPVFGVVPAGAAVMVAMYGLSIGAALGMAALFKRTLLKSPTPALVLELPPYRWPKPGQVVRVVLSRVRVFLVDAGTTILAITVVLWALFTFPRDPTLEQAAEGARSAVLATTTEGTERDEKLAAVEARRAEEQVKQSIAGTVGRAIEPVFAPLGFDWKLDVGILASFAAREVLVSTLGLVYGIGEGADEESTSLRDAMQRDKKEDGTPVYTPLTGLSLMVFFVLAMQCMSTLAAVKRETGGWKWPAVQFGYMSVLAYVASLLVYQVGSLLGFGA